MPEQEEVTQDSKATAVDRSGSAGATIASLKRKLREHKQRIEGLERDHEENAEHIGKLQAELALVAAERDKLRKALTDIEGMQTDTVALGEGDIADFVVADEQDAPSIDELMSTFSGIDTGSLVSYASIHAGAESGEYQEMISPEDIVLGPNRDKGRSGTERYLVLFDEDSHVRCPLDQELLTIGRSDSADIQIDGDFVSRIHARVLRIGMDSVIEDAGSKNGTRVNSDSIQRHVLKHGDLVRVGSVCFRYIDTAVGSDLPE